MTIIRDFMYLDVQRLRSFASQLLPHGVPTEATHSDTTEASGAAEVKGGVPLLIEGAANTKAVLSATSTVIADVHHKLIDQVLNGLREEKLLTPEDEARGIDGAFVLLEAQVQIIDPDPLRELIRKFPGLERSIQVAVDPDAPIPATARSKADRRAGRNREPQGSLSQRQADAVADLMEFFTPGTVRLRFVRAGETVATAVVERDKFVEDLDRLVRRHGYLTGGCWEVLGQVNLPADADLYTPDGTTVMDVIEASMLGPISTLANQSGTTTATGLTITPLAVYRVVKSR